MILASRIFRPLLLKRWAGQPRRLFSYLNFKSVTNSQISRFLNDNNCEHRLRPNGQVSVRICPLCPKPHNDDPTNMWTLNFKKDDGAFMCFRCGVSGSWVQFVRALTEGTREQPSFEPEPKIPLEKVKTFHEEKHQNLTRTFETLSKRDRIDPLEKKQLQLVDMVKYLADKENGRGLSPEVLTAYQVGIGQEMFKNAMGEYELVDVVSFPYFGKQSKLASGQLVVTRTKMRGLKKENKHYMRFYPPNAFFGVFGLNLVLGEIAASSVIITEGEFDAMAAYQVTGIPAISLPYGASNLPPEMVSLLKNIKQIYLWMDFDEVGQFNIQTFSEKLGVARTAVIKQIPEAEIEEIIKKEAANTKNTKKPVNLDASLARLKSSGVKDANDALLICPGLVKEYVHRAKSTAQSNIVQFKALRNLVRERIFHQDRFRGVTSVFFPWFNKLVKGFRRGE